LFFFFYIFIIIFFFWASPVSPCPFSLFLGSFMLNFRFPSFPFFGLHPFPFQSPPFGGPLANILFCCQSVRAPQGDLTEHSFWGDSIGLDPLWGSIPIPIGPRGSHRGSSPFGPPLGGPEACPFKVPSLTFL